ncbi:MAG: hypothetical protein NWT08_11510 [Akkermansiaceae bacterium]|nr:hypothetical protein [Akkermansiaceae bacterium]MDP4781002.1 hypothetical protein [Akkermansiaceae bacterium]MDP4898771.1 hypothetical protein [Akkermansiaceae bacterium]MDP4996631.1 hypothetical protein [Akkermansiaceae bacterium]
MPIPLLRYRTLALVAACCSAALMFGCTAGGGDFLDSTSSSAKDRIMYVREKPPTFGHFRLQAFISKYPDLGTFVSRRNSPEFLAETDKGDSHILILYYLEKRQAYACRCEAGTSNSIEFSGPYPITDGEAKTLRNLRDGGSATDS